MRFDKDEKICGAGAKSRIFAELVNVFGYHNPCYLWGRTWGIWMQDAAPNRLAKL